MKPSPSQKVFGWRDALDFWSQAIIANLVLASALSILKSFVAFAKNKLQFSQKSGDIRNLKRLGTGVGDGVLLPFFCNEHD